MSRLRMSTDIKLFVHGFHSYTRDTTDQTDSSKQYPLLFARFERAMHQLLLKLHLIRCIFNSRNEHNRMQTSRVHEAPPRILWYFPLWRMVVWGQALISSGERSDPRDPHVALFFTISTNRRACSQST